MLQPPCIGGVTHGGDTRVNTGSGVSKPAKTRLDLELRGALLTTLFLLLPLLFRCDLLLILLRKVVQYIVCIIRHILHDDLSIT